MRLTGGLRDGGSGSDHDDGKVPTFRKRGEKWGTRLAATGGTTEGRALSKTEPSRNFIWTSAFLNLLTQSRCFLLGRFLPLCCQSLKFRQFLKSLELGGFQRGGFMEPVCQREL